MNLLSTATFGARFDASAADINGLLRYAMPKGADIAPTSRGQSRWLSRDTAVMLGLVVQLRKIGLSMSRSKAVLGSVAGRILGDGAEWIVLLPKSGDLVWTTQELHRFLSVGLIRPDSHGAPATTIGLVDIRRVRSIVDECIKADAAKLGVGPPVSVLQTRESVKLGAGPRVQAPGTREPQTQEKAITVVGERFVSFREIMTRLGIRSQSTVYAYVDSGFLPPIKRFGPRRWGWVASEIDAWFASRDRREAGV